VASGAYVPTVGKILALERIAEAHAAQESGSVVGKILVAIHPETETD